MKPVLLLVLAFAVSLFVLYSTNQPSQTEDVTSSANGQTIEKNISAEQEISADQESETGQLTAITTKKQNKEQGDTEIDVKTTAVEEAEAETEAATEQQASRAEIETNEVTSSAQDKEASVTPPTLRQYYPPRFVQAKNYLQNDPTDPTQLSEEAEVLKDLDLPEQTAMNALHIILESAGRISNQGYMRTGSNVEVVNGLLGDNYRKIAYLSDDHPRLNEYGEVIDSWSTPYYFHFLSSTNVEIISAGPDKQHYTDDDIVLDVE